MTARSLAIAVGAISAMVLSGCSAPTAGTPTRAAPSHAPGSDVVQPPAPSATAAADAPVAVPLLDAPPADVCAALGINARDAQEVTGNPITLSSRPTVGQPSCVVDVTERALDNATDFGAILGLTAAEPLTEELLDQTVGDVASKRYETVPRLGDEATLTEIFRGSDDRPEYLLMANVGPYRLVVSHIIFSRNDPDHSDRARAVVLDMAALAIAGLGGDRAGAAATGPPAADPDVVRNAPPVRDEPQNGNWVAVGTNGRCPPTETLTWSHAPSLDTGSSSITVTYDYRNTTCDPSEKIFTLNVFLVRAADHPDPQPLAELVSCMDSSACPNRVAPANLAYGDFRGVNGGSGTVELPWVGTPPGDGDYWVVVDVSGGIRSLRGGGVTAFQASRVKIG